MEDIWASSAGNSFARLGQHTTFPPSLIGEDLGDSHRPPVEGLEPRRASQNEQGHRASKIELPGSKPDERGSSRYHASNKRQRLDSAGDRGSISSTATSSGGGPHLIHSFDGPSQSSEPPASYLPYLQEGRTRPRDSPTMPDNSEMIVEHGKENAKSKCASCDRVGSSVPQMINSLRRLNLQLAFICKGEEHPYESAGQQPSLTSARAADDMIYQLDLGIAKLNNNIHLVNELLTSNTSHEGRKRFHSLTDDSTRFPDPTPGFPDSRRRSSGRDSIVSLFGSNLQRIPSPLSGSVQPQSPSQPSISNRMLPTLPSPSSLNFSTSTNTLPPMSPSLLNSGTRSPHTAHLQELQHQLSTKSLAHQILLGEHEKLLAAFSRSQTRCATLDKKSQVSDLEINELAEERSRLQNQIETLEQQVSELQQDRDDALKQSALNGSQYMQIMSMSSKLQAQSLLDAKKWKTDRDLWQDEKGKLLARVAELESVSAIPPHETDNRNSISPQAELVSLRRNKIHTDRLLDALKSESSAVMKILTEFGGLSDRLQKIAGDEIPR